MLLAESLANSGREGLACVAEKKARIFTPRYTFNNAYTATPCQSLTLSLEERAQLISIAVVL